MLCNHLIQYPTSILHAQFFCSRVMFFIPLKGVQRQRVSFFVRISNFVGTSTFQQHLGGAIKGHFHIQRLQLKDKKGCNIQWPQTISKFSLIMLPRSFYTTCFKEFPMHEWISWVKEQEWKISMNSSLDPRILATFPIWIGLRWLFHSWKFGLLWLPCARGWVRCEKFALSLCWGLSHYISILILWISFSSRHVAMAVSD